MKPRWWFAAATALGALAVTVLSAPFSGIATMACVATFITGGNRILQGSDPETVKKVTRSGIPGGGF